MVKGVWRGVVLLWAIFFATLGVRGLFDPSVYASGLGIAIEPAATNSLRADLSAFFIVASGGAALGALVPGWTRALLVPAALYGMALLGRLIGAALGDPVNGLMIQAMIAEALSVTLMIASWRVLSRSGLANAATAPDSPSIH